MDETTSTSTALAYASVLPVPGSQGPRVWAATMILLGGLGLVVLGGCFLVGVLAMHVNMMTGGKMPPVTGAGNILLVVLYLLAFACFAGAVAVILSGVRALLRVVRNP